MSGSLASTVALVTGGAAGIGRAAAELLAERGAAVLVADADGGAAADTTRSIVEAGGVAESIAADVGDEAAVQAMVRAALDSFGGLDIAFNNAGIAVPMCDLEHLAAVDFDRLVAANLRGVWLSMKHELAVMVPRGRGAIVNTSSVAGLVGAAGSAAYAASKHGVVGLTRSAAAEHGKHGIRINAIAPGLTRTRMVEQLVASGAMNPAAHLASTPLGRMAEPREIAEAVVWLCSPEASFVTGHVLAVDGGESAV